MVFVGLWLYDVLVIVAVWLGGGGAFGCVSLILPFSRETVRNGLWWHRSVINVWRGSPPGCSCRGDEAANMPNV